MSLTVLATDSKSAALYFDYVIPMTAHVEAFSDLTKRTGGAKASSSEWRDAVESGETRGQIDQWFEELLPEPLKKNKDLVHEIGLGLLASAALEKLKTLGREKFGEHAETIRPDFDIDGCLKRFEQLDGFGKKKFYELLSLGGIGQIIFDTTAPGAESNTRPEVKLLQCNLIDPRKASWGQIIDFRNDKKSRLALLNFRKYFFEEFDGKSIDQIIEEIELLQLQYEAAAEKHGFELAKQSMGTILTSKAVYGGGAVSIVSALLGAAPLAAAAFAVPVVCELGKLALEVKSNAYAKAEFQQSHPISYIKLIESKLGTNQPGR